MLDMCTEFEKKCNAIAIEEKVNMEAIDVFESF